MRKTIFLALSLLLLGGTAYAKQDNNNGNGKGKNKKEKHQKHSKHNKKGKGHKGKGSKKFSRAEEMTAQSYYRNLPPGLAKKYKRTGKLPRGWKQKVHAGQRLPQSYIIDLQPVPRELRATFEVGPIGSEVMRMGNKIIRLEQATNMILDVFEL